jgi:hypothetical protein
MPVYGCPGTFFNRLLAQPGEASEHVRKAASVAHFPPDMNTWNEAQVSFAIATAKGFEAMRRQAKAKGAGLKASAPATAVAS